MIAGHDTTAYQISWIIIELSRNPDVVSKLRLELDALFPCRQYSNVAFTMQQLSKLSYLSSVIKEGMRLWPVAAIGTSRLVAADILFRDKIIPKGTIASVGFFAMFRTGIRDPHDFIPERWADSDPDAAKLKELSFPFSTGKRACVGQNLALLELKLVLANLIYSYDFELVSDISEMYYITLKPQNANFKVSRRP
jgi:cholesterol 24-hydroxylase